MKVLLVAPDNPDLKTIDAEVAMLTRYHDVEKLIGEVREVDIQRAVEKGEYDVVWWATHGGNKGVLLSNGYVLSVEAVGQYVGASRAKLCVLNTCDSEGGANKIVAGGDADMICTISPEVGDEDALRFGGLLAKELSETDDFEAAFDKAKGPGATKYRYIQAKQALRGLAVSASDGIDRVKDEISALKNEQYRRGVDLDDLKKTVERLTTQMQQNQQQATAAQTSAGQMANMERSLTASQQPSAFTPMFWLVLVAVAGLLVVIVLLLSGRTL